MVLRLQDLTSSSSDHVLTHYFLGNDMYSQLGHPRSEVRDLSTWWWFFGMRDLFSRFEGWDSGMFWMRDPKNDLRDCSKIWDWKTGVNYNSMGDPQPRTLPWAVTSQRETRPLFPRLRQGERSGTGLGDPLKRTKHTRGKNMHDTQ